MYTKTLDYTGVKGIKFIYMWNALKFITRKIQKHNPSFPSAIRPHSVLRLSLGRAATAEDLVIALGVTTQTAGSFLDSFQ